MIVARPVGNGTFGAILRFRCHESRVLIAPLLISILPRTVGLMYLGMAAWRSGVVRQPERYRAKLTLALVCGAVAGAVITINALWAMSSGTAPWPALATVNAAGPILLALAYVSGLLLWLTSRHAPHFPGIAATGQMALTNYLLQSILLGSSFVGTASVCLGG
jgi:uncharacterized protein